MRISDWSSDVCSSDLRRHVASNHHLDCLGFGVLHRDLLTRLVAAVAELLVQRPLGTGGHVESLAEGDAGLFAFRGVADGIGTEEEGGAVAAGCFPARAVDAQGAGRQRRAEADRKSTRLNSSH